MGATNYSFAAVPAYFLLAQHNYTEFQNKDIVFFKPAEVLCRMSKQWAYSAINFSKKGHK